MDEKFNPLFPPPVHSTVDDFHFKRAAMFLDRDFVHYYKLQDADWCDLPTSSWRQLNTSLRWQRIN